MTKTTRGKPDPEEKKGAAKDPATKSEKKPEKEPVKKTGSRTAKKPAKDSAKKTATKKSSSSKVAGNATGKAAGKAAGKNPEEAGKKQEKRRNPVFERITSESMITRIRGWCMEGATNSEIAERLGISDATFYRYQQQSPELKEALLYAKEIVDYRVENALLRRALGYDTVETVTEETAAGKVTRTVRKHIPPDVTAGIFWLKNRKPDRWRQKPEFIPEDTGTGVIMMPEILEEDADADQAETI